MRSLYIVFTKSKKRFPIGSWLIRKWTGKPYSHVAAAFNLGSNFTMCYQANDGKVNFEVIGEFVKKHEIIYSYNMIITTDHFKQILVKSAKEAGKPYGLMQNIGIVLCDIALKFGKKIKNPWKTGTNCSELIYKELIIPLYGDLDYDPNLIKPHQIEEIIKAQKILQNP